MRRGRGTRRLGFAQAPRRPRPCPAPSRPLPARVAVAPKYSQPVLPPRRGWARLGAGNRGHPPVYRSGARMAPKLPDSVEELRAAGNLSFRNGQFAEAATLYSRALRMLQAQGATPAPHFAARLPSPSCLPRPQLPRRRSGSVGLGLPYPEADWPTRPSHHPPIPPPSPSLGILRETSLAFLSTFIIIVTWFYYWFFVSVWIF